MKIYNKITLGWNEETERYDDVLFEDSFEYTGPMMLAATADGWCGEKYSGQMFDEAFHCNYQGSYSWCSQGYGDDPDDFPCSGTDMQNGCSPIDGITLWPNSEYAGMCSDIPSAAVQWGLCTDDDYDCHAARCDDSPSQTNWHGCAWNEPQVEGPTAIVEAPVEGDPAVDARPGAHNFYHFTDASLAGDDSITSWQWTVTATGGGNVYTGASHSPHNTNPQYVQDPTFILRRGYAYVVSLTVQDNYNNSSSTTLEFQTADWTCITDDQCEWWFDDNYGCHDSVCLYEGCTDPDAQNTNPSAEWDDGSCVYSGPTADFTWVETEDPCEGGLPNDYQVHFTDTSESGAGTIDSWTWEAVGYESGSVTGSGSNPTLCLDWNQQYDVTLTVTTEHGSHSTTYIVALASYCTSNAYCQTQYGSDYGCHDNVCMLEGCTDPYAGNYQPDAQWSDNELCTYPPPVADFYWTEAEIDPGTSSFQFFDQSQTGAPDSDLLSIVSYTWNLYQDNTIISTSSETNPSWSLSWSNPYWVELIIVDSEGQTDTTSQDVTSNTYCITDQQCIDQYGEDFGCHDSICLREGCTDNSSTSHPVAGYEFIGGQVGACNYDDNVGAEWDDGSCIYPVIWRHCDGSCVNDTDGDDICNEEDEFPECPADVDGNHFFDACGVCNGPGLGTFPDCNYWSCDYAPHYQSCVCVASDCPGVGCTDPFACNWDPGYYIDDGSCEYDFTCWNGQETCYETQCIEQIFGCTDSAAENYDPSANSDDGSCEYAPIIEMIIDHAILDTETALFDASATTDPDDPIEDLIFEWSVVSVVPNPENNIELLNSATVVQTGDYVATFTPPEISTGMIYTWTVNTTVTDPGGLSNTQPVAIQVTGTTLGIGGCIDPAAANFDDEFYPDQDCGNCCDVAIQGYQPCQCYNGVVTDTLAGYNFCTGETVPQCQDGGGCVCATACSDTEESYDDPDIEAAGGCFNYFIQSNVCPEICDNTVQIDSDQSSENFRGFSIDMFEDETIDIGAYLTLNGRCESRWNDVEIGVFKCSDPMDPWYDPLTFFNNHFWGGTPADMWPCAGTVRVEEGTEMSEAPDWNWACAEPGNPASGTPWVDYAPEGWQCYTTIGGEHTCDADPFYPGTWTLNPARCNQARVASGFSNAGDYIGACDEIPGQAIIAGRDPIAECNNAQYRLNDALTWFEDEGLGCRWQSNVFDCSELNEEFDCNIQTGCIWDLEACRNTFDALVYNPNAGASNGDVVFSLITSPSNGTLEIDGSSVIYTPTPDWNGVDEMNIGARTGTVGNETVFNIPIEVNVQNKIDIPYIILNDDALLYPDDPNQDQYTGVVHIDTSTDGYIHELPVLIQNTDLNELKFLPTGNLDVQVGNFYCDHPTGDPALSQACQENYEFNRSTYGYYTEYSEFSDNQLCTLQFTDNLASDTTNCNLLGGNSYCGGNNAQTGEGHYCMINCEGDITCGGDSGECKIATLNACQWTTDWDIIPSPLGFEPAWPDGDGYVTPSLHAHYETELTDDLIEMYSSNISINYDFQVPKLQILNPYFYGIIKVKLWIIKDPGIDDRLYMCTEAEQSTIPNSRGCQWVSPATLSSGLGGWEPMTVGYYINCNSDDHDAEILPYVADQDNAPEGVIMPDTIDSSYRLAEYTNAFSFSAASDTGLLMSPLLYRTIYTIPGYDIGHIIKIEWVGQLGDAVYENPLIVQTLFPDSPDDIPSHYFEWTFEKNGVYEITITANDIFQNTGSSAITVSVHDMIDLQQSVTVDRITEGGTDYLINPYQGIKVDATNSYDDLVISGDGGVLCYGPDMNSSDMGVGYDTTLKCDLEVPSWRDANANACEYNYWDPALLLGGWTSYFSCTSTQQCIDEHGHQTTFSGHPQSYFPSNFEWICNQGEVTSYLYHAGPSQNPPHNWIDNSTSPLTDYCYVKTPSTCDHTDTLDCISFEDKDRSSIIDADARPGLGLYYWNEINCPEPPCTAVTTYDRNWENAIAADTTLHQLSEPFTYQGAFSQYELFTPDVDIRTVFSLQDSYDIPLFNYYDKVINSTEYYYSTVPGNVQLSFYPRLGSNYLRYSTTLGGAEAVPLCHTTPASLSVYSYRPKIMSHHMNFDLFFIVSIDWGDGTPVEHDREPYQLTEGKMIHNYKKEGLYTISGYMISMNSEFDLNDFYSEDNLETGNVTSWKKFNINIEVNNRQGVEDFKLLGGLGYTYIPWYETTPIISGISENSLYYKTLSTLSGAVIDNTDEFVPLEFPNIGEQIRIENALAITNADFINYNQIDKHHDPYGDQSYKVQNLDGEDIYYGKYNKRGELGEWVGNIDLAQARVFTRPLQMYEMLGFEGADISDDVMVKLYFVMTPNISAYSNSINYYVDDSQVHQIEDVSGIQEYEAELIFRLSPDEDTKLLKIEPTASGTILWQSNTMKLLDKDRNVIIEDITITNESYDCTPINAESIADSFGYGDYWDIYQHEFSICELTNGNITYWSIRADSSYVNDISLTAGLTNSEIGFIDISRSILEQSIIEEDVVVMGSDADNPGHERYWKNIIPESHILSDREGILFDETGQPSEIDESSSQEWIGTNEYGHTYYYPVLPKLSAGGAFSELLGLQTDGGGVEKIPFGAKETWNSDDTVALITQAEIDDESLNCIVDLNFSEVTQEALEDNSGGNKGMLIGDYGFASEVKDIRGQNYLQIVGRKSNARKPTIGKNNKIKAY